MKKKKKQTTKTTIKYCFFDIFVWTLSEISGSILPEQFSLYVLQLNATFVIVSGWAIPKWAKFAFPWLLYFWNLLELCLQPMVLIPFGFSELLIHHVDVITAVNMISQPTEGCTFVPWKKKGRHFLKPRWCLIYTYVCMCAYIFTYIHIYMKKHVFIHCFSFHLVSPYKLPNPFEIVWYFDMRKRCSPHSSKHNHVCKWHCCAFKLLILFS